MTCRETGLEIFSTDPVVKYVIEGNTYLSMKKKLENASKNLTVVQEENARLENIIQNTKVWEQTNVSISSQQSQSFPVSGSESQVKQLERTIAKLNQQYR